MITKATLLEEISQFPEPQLSQIKKAIKKCNKLVLDTSGEVGLTDSRLLGTPYWPKNKAYPTNSSGENMTLLAQINCKDLVVPMGLPNEGLLQIFVDEDEDELMEASNGQHKTVFHPTIDETNIVTDFEKEIGLDGLYYKYDNIKLSISESIEIPHPMGIEFKKQFGVKYLDSEFSKDPSYFRLAEKNSMHKIGHYTDWWEEDSRLEDGSYPHGNIKSQGNLVPLFQLYSNIYIEGLNEVLDSIRTIIFIDSQDLEALNFENTIKDAEVHA